MDLAPKTFRVAFTGDFFELNAVGCQTEGGYAWNCLGVGSGG
jgi:hypothetical protein